MDDPQPMAVLSYAPATEHPRPRWRAAARIFTVLASAVCVVGAVLIPAVHVKSVTISGPTLFVIACLGITAGVRIGRTDVWTLNAAHAAFCLLCVMLVNVLHWSPRKATMPFTLMSSAWAVAATVATVIVLRRMSRPTNVF